MSSAAQDLEKASARPAVDVLALLQLWKKELAVGAALMLVIAAPFLLRPSETSAPSRYDRRLVIMTSHPEATRYEFGRGFARHWKQQTGETVYIDWRVAGTSELNLIMRSDYTAAFQKYWTVDKGQRWDHESGGFLTPTSTGKARQAFLGSNVGIGVDLFFGGGPLDFRQQAEAGILVAKDNATGQGLLSIQAKHPAWFEKDGIPVDLSGQVARDKDMRWCGTCLSSFGIVFNRDVLARLGIEKPPAKWSDLADPRLFGQLALADPSKSGSVTQAFEMILQQEMHAALARLKETPGRLRTPQEVEQAAVRQGWISGLQLIQKIAANARYFTDSSSKIPLEVAKGDAAAGMCVDFYGRTAEEHVRAADGTSRVGFSAPAGGTAVSVDPIGLMRGASQPALATAFMEWVLSDAGQRLWAFKKGVQGGPEAHALRRLPVRRDFYHEANVPFMSDPKERPWEMAEAFVYRPEWTSRAFSVLRFVIRVTCIDTHKELKHAWGEIVSRGMPERATDVLGQLPGVNYDLAMGDLAAVLSARDKVREVREARRLIEACRRQYQQAANIAKAGGRR